ncbi:MAG: FtsB family cell division protein [Chlorobiota bacterium]
MSEKEKLYQNPIKRHFVVGGVLICIILVFYLFTDYGIISKYNYISKRNELKDKSERLISEIDSIKALTKQLKSDTLEMERLAREKYGMVKEGETVLFLKKSEDEESGD